MNNLFNIRDYVVVITGGTGILGRCIAKYHALEGAKVIIGGRKENVGAEVVNDITVAGGECEFVKMDVMNTEQNRALLTNPDGSYTKRGNDVIRQTPFSRMGEPEELCGTIHYLMSDAAKFVTGTVAVVDGVFNVTAM
ncbi:MAG: SDR family oxidoreductase [Prevotella sp.]|nr:SDR family oxidoreductase [Prevotella sp.]